MEEASVKKNEKLHVASDVIIDIIYIYIDHHIDLNSTTFKKLAEDDPRSGPNNCSVHVFARKKGLGVVIDVIVS